MTQFRFKVHGEYVIGALDLPTDVGSLSVRAVGDSKADALVRAAAIADRIAQDPVMSALLPPQATAAIAASKALGVAAKRGLPHLKKVWRSLRGEGKKRLAAVLATEAHKLDEEARTGEIRYPNRGAWQTWQDPYADVDPSYDDAEGYDEDYSDVDLGWRPFRKKKKKKKRAARRDNRADAEGADGGGGGDDEPAEDEQAEEQELPVEEG